MLHPLLTEKKKGENLFMAWTNFCMILLCFPITTTFQNAFEFDEEWERNNNLFVTCNN